MVQHISNPLVLNRTVDNSKIIRTMYEDVVQYFRSKLLLCFYNRKLVPKIAVGIKNSGPNI